MNVIRFPVPDNGTIEVYVSVEFEDMEDAHEKYREKLEKNLSLHLHDMLNTIGVKGLTLMSD